MKENIIGILLLGLTLCSCTQKKTVEQVPEYPVTVESLPLADSLLMRYPSDLLKLNDSILVIEDFGGVDHLYYAISLTGRNVLYSFGQRGKGPGEVMSSSGLQLHAGQLYTFDTNRDNILIFNVDSLRNGRLNMPDKIITYDESVIPVNDFVILSDGTFITLNMDGSSRLNHLGPDGKLLEQLFEFPSEASSSDPLVDRGLKGLWSSVIRYDSVSKQLITATILGDVIDFYDLSDQRAHSPVQFVGADGVPEMTSIGDKTSIAGKVKGYVDLATDGQYLYALYSGFEMRRIYEQNEHAPAGGSIVKVIDLKNKKHMCNIRLDRAVNGLCPDLSNNRMLATDANGENVLCVFTLPDFE